MTQSVVVVGAGEAGGQAAISLRQGGFTGPVTIVGDEPYIPYERPALSKQFLAGTLDLERLYLRTSGFYAERDITLKLNETVTAIEPGLGVTLGNGELLESTDIILATGGRVRRLSVPGASLQRIHYLRTINDVLGFRDQMKSGLKLAIVGGGYIGLEVAAVAAKLGCSVTVLESDQRVLSRVAAPEASAFYEKLHREEGVDIRTAVTVSEFSGDRHVHHLKCLDGTEVKADLVVVGIGIIPNTELAESAHLKVDNGIFVDDLTRTSSEHVYAIGDCSNHPNALLNRRLRLESVQSALSQGKTAANTILGYQTPYAEIPWFWSDQYDVKLQMAGINDPGDDVIIRGDPNSRSFSICYLREGRLVAINAINRAKDFLQSKKAIAANISPDTTRLSDPETPIKEL